MAEYEVVLLRHGETVGYDADHGLTPLGEEQARDRGAALAAEIKPGTTVRMPHARTARAIATARTVRAALVTNLADGVHLGPLHPEPWFDNLRYSRHGESIDPSSAASERLTLTGDLPDWAREYDRFDTDYRSVAAAGRPIEYWLHNPTLWFEPPHVAAHRIWRGIAAERDDAAENLMVVVATHSAPMRAFMASTLGTDPGEPHNLEDIRVRVRDDGSSAVTFRGETTAMSVPPQLPPWIDRAWLESFGR